MKKKEEINGFSAYTAAYAYNAYGYVYKNILTTGAHTYQIDNYTKASQTYTIELSLCYAYSYYRDKTILSIPPNGYYRNTANSALTLLFERPGNFDLKAMTSISGESSSYDEHHATINVKS